MTPPALAVVVTLTVLGATVPRWGSPRRASRGPAGSRAVERRRGDGRAARRGPRAEAAIDAVLLLDLLDVAIATGVSIPRALSAVGAAVGGAQGAVLARGGTALVLGAPWSAAWSGAEAALVEVVGALEASWVTGSAPGPALRARADQLRRERRTRARAAAGTLGVHLVLPLGLCFLPAFVLLGLVPMLLSLAGDLLG